MIVGLSIFRCEQQNGFKRHVTLAGTSSDPCTGRREIYIVHGPPTWRAAIISTETYANQEVWNVFRPCPRTLAVLLASARRYFSLKFPCFISLTGVVFSSRRGATRGSVVFSGGINSDGIIISSTLGHYTYAGRVHCVSYGPIVCFNYAVTHSLCSEQPGTGTDSLRRVTCEERREWCEAEVPSVAPRRAVSKWTRWKLAIDPQALKELSRSTLAATDNWHHS